MVLLLGFALLLFVLGYYLGVLITRIARDRMWEKRLPDIRKDAVSKSRSVIGGQFSEQLAPYLPDFPYNPTEVRFLGKPVDFIAFRGMDATTIDHVAFIEVKSGDARLNGQQRRLREAIENGRVSFEEYRIPKRLTR